MNRRIFLCGLTLGTVAAPRTAEAQPSGKIPRIGFVSNSSASDPTIDGLKQGLRDHGYLEGRNLLIDWYFAEGRDERLPGFAAELVSFVRSLNMGKFYSQRIHNLIGPPARAVIGGSVGGPDLYKERMEEHRKEYLDQLRGNRDAVEKLVVEMLRYQQWVDEGRVPHQARQR